MTKRVYSFLLFCVFLSVISCNVEKSSSDSAPFSSVSVYALSPDAPSFNLFVNGYNIATNVPFGSYTLYNQVMPGQTEFKAETSYNNVSSDTGFATSEGMYYSVYLIDTMKDMKTVITKDVLGDTTANTIKLRFFNFSPDAPLVDVHAVSSDSSVNEIWWKNRSINNDVTNDSINKFTEKNLGLYSFYITPSGKLDTLARFTGRSLITKGYYTILLAGKFKTNSDTTLQLTIRRH